MAAVATIPRVKVKPAQEPDPIVIPPIALRVPVDKVDIGENVRAEVGDLADLVASIRQHGLLQPIGVRDSTTAGRFDLVYGQRRLLAARQAGWTHIPAIGMVFMGSRGITQLVENLQRQDLNPLEEARAFQQLLAGDKSLTQAELARQIGRSAPYVSNALRILELDAKVLPLVASGQLSGSHAKALASVPAKAQRDLADRAVKGEWSAHELERQVTYLRDEAKSKAAELAKAEKVADKAEELLLAAGATKEVSTLAGDGYYSNEALKALKKRGWKLFEGYRITRGEACDCDAWQLDLNWQGTLNRVLRACVSKAHGDAERARNDEAWKEKRARQERDEKAAAALRAKMLKPVVDYVAGDSPFRRRLQLFALVDASYQATDAFLQRHGAKDQSWTRQGAKVWGQITKLADAKVETELARVLAAGILTTDTPAGLRDSLLKNVPGLKALQPAKKGKAQA